MRNYLLLALTAIVISIVYLLRYDAVRPHYQSQDKLKITGILSAEPQIVEQKQKITLQSIDIYLDRYPELHYGDRLIITGEITKGEHRWFLKDPKIVESSNLSKEDPLQKFRVKVLAIFGKYLPTPFDGLSKGIVLGTKNSLESGFFEDLKKTGTLHVVVASGTNITLFSGVLLYLLAPLLGRRSAISVTIVLVWLYVVVIGFQPPIIRAAIMGSIVFTAVALGREASGLKALLVSATVMLLLNPLWAFDLGFQLSIAATLGILLFSKKFLQISHYIAFLPQIFKNDLATSLAAGVLISPLLFFTFGQISIIAPIVNMLVLWTVPIIMLGGMIFGLLGVLWEPLGQLGMYLIYPFLWYFVTVVELFAAV